MTYDETVNMGRLIYKWYDEYRKDGKSDGWVQKAMTFKLEECRDQWEARNTARRLGNQLTGQTE